MGKIVGTHEVYFDKARIITTSDEKFNLYCWVPLKKDKEQGSTMDNSGRPTSHSMQGSNLKQRHLN